MSIAKDLWYSNLKVFRKTVDVLRKNRLLFSVGIPYMLILFIAEQIAVASGIFAGLIMLLIQSAVISDYLHLINRIIRYGEFGINDFKSGFRVYFRKVYISLLMIRIVYLGIDVFFDMFGMLRFYLYLLLSVGLFIFLNPLLEVIYLKHLSEWDGFKYSSGFIKDNWLDWFLPNSLLFVVLYAIYRLIGIIVLRLPIMMKSYNIVLAGFLFALTAPVIVGFGMVYRGYLFDLLSKTTRRKRLFTRHLH